VKKPSLCKSFWINWRRNWQKVAKVIGVAPPSRTGGGVGVLLPPKTGLPPRTCGHLRGAHQSRKCLPKYKCIVEERGVVASRACIRKALYPIAATLMTMIMKMLLPHSLRISFNTMRLTLVEGRQCGTFMRFVALYDVQFPFVEA
jgi:hypothetical protein